MKHQLGGFVKIIRWNWEALVLFEIVYKVLLLLLAQPGADILRYALDAAGIKYLTNHNILQILDSPVAVGLILLLLLIIIYLSFVEIAVLILYCYYAAQDSKTGMGSVIMQGIKRALSIYQPKNLWMMIFVLFMLPLSGILVMSGPLSSLKIPGFVLEFIHQNGLLSILYGVLILAVSFVLYLWIFSIHEFVLHPCSFKYARQKSLDLMKGRKIRTLLYLISGIIFAYLTAYIIANAVVLGLLFWTKAIKESHFYFWFHYHNLEIAGNILFSVLRAICMIGMITFLYYKYQDKHIERGSGKLSARKRLVKVLQVMAAYIVILLYGELSYPMYNDFISPWDIQIVAHRAGAMFAPENTVAALKEAIKSGADAAEIDIQQTKDGQLIVMHDTNFKRTTGVDQNVWDAEYGDVKTYDAGSTYDPDFTGERVPTLEEMMAAAKGKIHLMIELKRAGHEEKMEEKILALMKKYQMQDQCTIASMDYQVLRRVKELDPKVGTVYITALAYGAMDNLTAADSISVEETFINKNLLGQAHALGKTVYAWTINREEDMKRMMKLKVDGIITDNVYYVSYVLETKGIHVTVLQWAEKILGEEI